MKHAGKIDPCVVHPRLKKQDDTTVENILLQSISLIAKFPTNRSLFVPCHAASYLF